MKVMSSVAIFFFICQHISSSTMSSFNHLADSAPLDQKEAEELERKESVTAAIEYIRGPFNDALSGTDPIQQKEIDQAIR